MKFLVVLCLIALAAGEEEKNQDKKAQTTDSIQPTTSGLTSPVSGSLLNGQVFPPTSFLPGTFATKDSVAGLPYTSIPYNGNISPIQGVNPDFFANAPAVVNGAIPTFPVTRTILSGSSPVVNGIQSAFPVGAGVLPPVINAIGTHFPAIAGGILSGVQGGGLDGNQVANQGLSSIPTTYRALSPEAYASLPVQGLQAAQTVIPAFASGILPSVTGGVLTSGQGLPAGVLKNPTPNPQSNNVPSLSTGNISSGPLANVFRRP